MRYFIIGYGLSGGFGGIRDYESLINWKIEITD